MGVAGVSRLMMYVEKWVRKLARRGVCVCVCVCTERQLGKRYRRSK